MGSYPQIILVDGPSGSGKTTLALNLQKEFNCEVIHLDSIYNGWDDALGKTLTNRLIALVENFLRGEEYELPIFDWHKNRYESTHIVKPAQALIIEGVGAGQSAIRDKASKLYWVEASPEHALTRVLERDGYEIKEHMLRFKVSEAKHFEVERTREFADFIITTS